MAHDDLAHDDLAHDVLGLDALRAFYRTGEEIVLAPLPAGSTRVLARRVTGEVFNAELRASGAQFAWAFAPGTYAVEVVGADGEPRWPRS